MTFDTVSILIAATLFSSLAVLIWLFVKHAKKDSQRLIEEIRKENTAAKENAADTTKQRRVRGARLSTRRRSHWT
jgi:type II secretory pathway component PulJ